MKRSIILIPVLAAVIPAACTKEAGAPTAAEGTAVKIQAQQTVKTALEGPDDGTFSVKWTAGDVLGVWSTSGNTTTFTESGSLAADAAVAEFPVILPSAASELTLTAVYPAKAVSTQGNATLLTIPGTQTSTDGSFDPASDILVATPATLAEGAATVKMQFHRPGSIMRFEVVGLDPDETLSSLQITSDGTALAGSWSFNPVTGEVEVRSEGITSIIVNANSNVAAARVFAGTFESMSLKVTTSKNSYLKSYNNRFTLKPDQVECFTISITPGEKMDGDGTAANPYVITSKENLLAISSLLKNGTATYFKLENDLDLSSIENWDPINPTGDNMRIDLDGQEHTIYNMTTSGKKYGSFFGLLSGNVRNLNFDNCTSTAINGGVAGIVCGWCGIQNGSFTASCTNCHVTNSVVNTDNTATNPVIGGFTGKAGAATLSNCSFQGSVSCTTTGNTPHTGGFVGEVWADSSLDSISVNATTYSAGAYVGGITGYCDEGSFNKCHVIGDVTAGKNTSNYSYCGGIIGYGTGTANPTITSCSYKGSIETAGKVTGGIIGQVSCASGTTTITGCTVEGSIHGSEFIAGVLSYNQKGTLVMSGCTCTATITCDSDTCAGMVCYTANTSVSTITDCHVACDITGGKDGSSNGYCGGIIGQLNAHTTTIERCSYSGKLTTTGKYCGGILAGAKGTGGTAVAFIRNCSATGSIVAKGGYSGGISGDMGKNSEITNCFAGNTVTGDYSLGGILSRNSNNTNLGTNTAQNFNTPVTGCIAWNPSITATKSGYADVASAYSGGAVIGYSATLNTLSNCWRRPDMVFKYNTAANSDLDILFDQNDADASAPLVENYTDATKYKYYFPYHGKAAAEGETASQVAARIGWSATIWNLTGNEPKLK